MNDGLAPHRCPQMAHALVDPDVPLVYNDKFREYGLRILDGGTSVLLISHCPWDGVKLPESLRHEWFDRLVTLGLEPGDAGIPEELLTGAWWRDRSQ